MKEDDAIIIVSWLRRLWAKEQNNPKSKSRNEVEMNKCLFHDKWNGLEELGVT
jgi:hypothetical protein